LSPPWVTDIIVGEHFPGLTALDLSDIPHVGPAVVRGLARAKDRRFTRLDLSGGVFNSDQLPVVLRPPAPGQGEGLRLALGGASRPPRPAGVPAARLAAPVAEAPGARAEGADDRGRGRAGDCPKPRGREPAVARAGSERDRGRRSRPAGRVAAPQLLPPRRPG